MRRWTLPTATLLLLGAAACGSDNPPAADVGDTEAAERSTEPDVPVELSTDLTDAGGSVVGTAWLREHADDVAELDVEVAGLPQGFHAVHLVDDVGCDTLGTGSVESLPLPPLLVNENGIGTLTTLAGTVSLDELVTGGVAVVVDETAADSVAAVPPDPLAAGETICGAVSS